MDLLLDTDTHDMVFINGACPVTTNSVETVSQRLKVTLLTFLGEWFLDTSVGVPYFQQIFVKLRNKSTADVILQSIILEDPGVIEILSYESVIDRGDRTFTMEFSVRTDAGDTAAITVSLGG